MPTTFVFFRHAQGYHNLDGDIRGDIAYHDPIHLDAILTDFGINQAESNNIGDEIFDQVFCSPMRRCKQTLLGIYPNAKSLSVIVDDRLIEQPQGMHISDKRLDKNDNNSYTPLKWDTKLVSDINPYVLDANKDMDNIISFTQSVRDNYPNGKVLIVTHGKWLSNWFMIYKNNDKWFNNCESMRVTL